MLTLRRSRDRACTDLGWLRSFHSFSYADYYDAAALGFSNLRVLNEERLAPGTGFGLHAHRAMEVLTLVLAGELAFEDCGGRRSLLRAGEAQRLSAGSGLRRREFNPARAGDAHYLQIWIESTRRSAAPCSEQRRWGAAEKRGRLCVIAAPGGGDGALALHADATLQAGCFDGPESARVALDPRRHAYLQVLCGRIEANGLALGVGDALQLAGLDTLALSQGEEAEVLLLDLA